MEKDAHLVASLTCAGFGGALLALTALVAGYGALPALLAYSLGGSALLVLLTAWNPPKSPVTYSPS